MRRACLVLLASGVAWAQQPPERFRHAYDVRFLTAEIRQFPGPDLLETAADAAIGIMSAEDGSYYLGVTPEFITQSIVTNFDADSWSDERNSIECAGGILSVTQSKDVHDRIAEYLEMLRRRFSRRIVVEADVLLLSPAAYEASGAQPGVLSAEAEKALRDAAADPAKGSPVASLRAVAMNGQRVHAADVKRQTYIRDYDIEIAQRATVPDPVSDELKTGAVLDVRPLLSPDASSVLMDVRFTMASLLSLKSFDPGAEPLGQFQLPARDILRAKSTVACPSGKTLLFASGTGPGTEKGRTAVVLVRVSLDGEAGGDGTKSTEKRQMRMFDVATITAQVKDFPGPKLRRESGEAGSGPTTTFVAAEEGVGMDVESLVEVVKANVGGDSWSNSKNRIFAMGDQIVAVQTADVLDAIAKFLAEAAPRRARLVSVEAAVVALDEAGWLSRRAALSGASPAEADLKALLEAAARGEGAKLAAASRGLALNGQRFHVWIGPEQHVVGDYDVEVATKASATDPFVTPLRAGIVLDARATLAGDGKRLRADLRPEFTAAGEPAATDPKSPSCGKIQLAQSSCFEVNTQPCVAENTWFLAGVSSRIDNARREVLALLVRARSVEAK